MMLRDPITKKFVKRAAPATPAVIVKTDEPRGSSEPTSGAAPAASPKPPVTAAPAAPARKAWYETILGLALLCLAGAGCSSTVTIEDTHRGVLFQARVPVWPWQDSMRAIDRMNLSARGTNFTASLRGLNEEATTSTNLVDLFERGISAAVRAAKP